MSNHSIPQSTSPTLKSVIEQKINEKGLSRSELVSAIGYSCNVSKGCRRLDTFTRTLEAPSEEFVTKITAVLEIDPVTFYRAIKATQDQFNAAAKAKFKPYIQIKLGTRITPAFAAQMVFNKCSIPIPTELQYQSLQDEIQAVITIYKNHVTTVLSPNISKHVNGFHYHRKYNYYMKFNNGFNLEAIVSVQPLPLRKSPLGNKVFNLLSGGMG